MRKHVNRYNAIAIVALGLAAAAGFIAGDQTRQWKEAQRENNATQSKMYSKVEETLRLVRDELVPAAKAKTRTPTATRKAEKTADVEPMANRPE